jgi:membrane protein YqaA with SNARE-associated domain
MDKFEAYSFLFFDSLMGALILPHPEFVFHAMKIFGSYDKVLMVACASISGTIGLCANWFLGKALTTCKKHDFFTSDNLERTKLIEKYVKKYGLWGSILAPFYIAGALVVLALGFFEVPLKKIIPIALILKLIYYNYSLTIH